MSDDALNRFEKIIKDLRDIHCYTDGNVNKCEFQGWDDKDQVTLTIEEIVDHIIEKERKEGGYVDDKPVIGLKHIYDNKALGILAYNEVDEHSEARWVNYRLVHNFGRVPCKTAMEDGRIPLLVCTIEKKLE